MKKIHYMNLGYSKCGTTWLYDNLIQYPGIDFKGKKEYGYLFKEGYPLDDYIKYYETFDVSLNFNTFHWALDSKQFKDINNIATHFSFLVRNPYEICESLFNKTKIINNRSTYVTDLLKLNYFDFAKSIKRMQNNINKPILILYYDDIVQDPCYVIKQVIDHLKMPQSDEFYLQYKNDRINQTEYKYQLDFLKTEKDKINNWIDSFSNYVGRDVTSWKR